MNKTVSTTSLVGTLDFSDSLQQLLLLKFLYILYSTVDLILAFNGTWVRERY
ncbi:MAG: hypothetical protein FGF53_07260 [Candidatus Brockarchaeota archaeon]|nr:hypothetical protein [Candidatus Brockarchaeota archaeon]MBS7633109.1 hypothetical protein [Candidatus Bathyarchaeota archaeon]